ncbi:2-phosphosulfolactate phosphatase [soil metagenome]
MININVYLTHSLIQDDLVLKNKNVIVIDALRATSTISTALANGAKEIIPTETIATAVRVAKGSTNSLLCGERNGKIVEGFDLGNSPLEYTEEKVKDKMIALSTTNGSLTLSKCKHSKNCIIASFLNLNKIVEFVRTLNEDFIIICSGKLSQFCLEDTVCAGLLIRCLINDSSDITEYILKDSELVALNLAEMYCLEDGKISDSKIEEMFRIAEHGKFLIEKGMGDDLAACSKVDSIPNLPLCKAGIIRLKEQFEGDTQHKAGMKKLSITTKKDAQEIARQ